MPRFKSLITVVSSTGHVCGVNTFLKKKKIIIGNEIKITFNRISIFYQLDINVSINLRKPLKVKN